jgi:PAS domain S-box-containing protein
VHVPAGIHEQLEQTAALLETLLSKSPLGFAFFDTSLRLIRANQALAEMWGTEHDHMGHGLRVVALDADQIEPLLQRVLQSGQPVIDFELSQQVAGGLRYWLVSIYGVHTETGKMLGLGMLAHEISERKQAEQTLKENQTALQGLFESAPDAIVVVDRQGRMVRVNAQLKNLFGYEPQELLGQTVEVLIPRRFHSRHLGHRQAFSQAAMTRPMGAGLELLGQRKDGSEFPVDIMLSPMGPDGLVIATVRDVTERKRLETEREHLLAQAQKSEREALLLAKIASSLSLTSPLETSLNQIASLIAQATGAKIAMVWLLGQGQSLSVGSHNLVPEFLDGLNSLVQSGLDTPILKALHLREIQIIPHFRQQILTDPSYALVRPFVGPATWDTVVAVPLLRIKDVLGLMVVGYAAQHEPTTTDLLQLSTLASQVALVLENARLFAEASAKAALEERQKLARELHDSVSQALYGISLGLQSATLSLQGSQLQSSQAELAYARQMTETAIAEMKALIFELRPESLEQEGLVIALRKQVRAAELRHRLEFDLELNHEPPLSLRAKEMLYRIAQEAINNALKHARAQRIRLALTITPEQVVLEIADHGSGFDPTQNFPGHLGLRSMRERAELLGGSFELQSAPGSGTRVRVKVPMGA